MVDDTAGVASIAVFVGAGSGSSALCMQASEASARTIHVSMIVLIVFVVVYRGLCTCVQRPCNRREGRFLYRKVFMVGLLKVVPNLHLWIEGYRWVQLDLFTCAGWLHFFDGGQGVQLLFLYTGSCVQLSDWLRQGLP